MRTTGSRSLRQYVFCFPKSIVIRPEVPQAVDDISVDHAHVVQNYRAACEIAQRHERGEASTEDLRKAMAYYRELFDDLLELHEVRK